MAQSTLNNDLLPSPDIVPRKINATDRDSRKIISLGHRCEVAWQIRSFFDQPEAYPFDWLVTPLQTLPLMIDEQFSRIVEPNLLSVVQYSSGNTVHNAAYDCFLHHEFRRDSAGYIVPDWRDDIPHIGDKFDYLRRRWKALADFDGVLYFCRRFGNMVMPSEKLVDTPAEDYRNVYRALQRAFPLAELKLILFDCRDISESPSIYSVDIGHASPSDWPDPADLWKGKTINYEKFFRTISTNI